MSLMNLLRGVGDQFDFVPGFDPIKDKQGLLSQILSGSGRRAGGGMTPGAMPTAAPSYMPGAVESSPMPPVGMGRPLPGGAMMPTQAEPTAPPQWKNPVPAWQEFLLPTEFTDDRKAAALGKYNAEVAKYDAQQAAQQAAQARQARVSEGMSYGLTGKDLLAYAAAPDKFGENLAERQGVMSAGQSFQDGNQTAYTAPSPFESKTDAFGRPLPFDPTTGGYGEAVGEAEPMDFGGYAVDPLTMGTLGDFRTPAQSGEMSASERANLGLGYAKLEQEKETAAATSRPRAEDQNGVLRFVDTGEPVFPDVKSTAPINKPLIGAESMGRVAAGLPNMRQAVTDLKSALGVNIQDGTATTVEGGYRPDQDWGALVLDNIPFTGDVIARVAGGEDYQKFDNAYSTFEAAALPIMSGAAVTDSEAKRALKALRVRVGDTDQAVARKMANMERMVAGLEAAARGDSVALQSIVGVVNSGSTTTADNGLPPGFFEID